MRTMKVVFSIFVASLFVFGTYGWIFRELAPVTDPILKRLKYDCLPTDKKYSVGPMKANEYKYPSGACARVSCDSDDGTVTYVGCYPLAVEPHCKVESGQTNDYPRCCSVAVC